MAETNEAETPSATATADPQVVSTGLFRGELRAVQYLQNAGLIKGEDVFALTMAKRINHAINARYSDAYKDDAGRTISQMQAQFRADNDIKALMDGYLNALANRAQHKIDALDSIPYSKIDEPFIKQRESAENKRDKYRSERDYYRNDPTAIDNVVKKFPQVLTIDKYLPIGRLALELGMVAGDRQVAADMIDDVLSNAAAHSLLVIAQDVVSTSNENLARYREFPDEYARNIHAKAYDTAINTVPLDRVQIFDEQGAPELTQVQALKTLLSAQLHAMTASALKSDKQNPDKLAQTLGDIKPLVRDYQKAVTSLVHHFLLEGPGSADPHDMRMRTVAAQLKDKMAQSGLGEPLDRDQAKQLASSLASDTTTYLLQFNKDDLDARRKLAQLLKQVDPEMSLPASLPSDGIVPRLGVQPPAGSHTDRAAAVPTATVKGR